MSQTKTLLAILCGSTGRAAWNLDCTKDCQINFLGNENGELILRHEARAWIAAETEWKWLGGTPLDSIVLPSSDIDSENTSHGDPESQSITILANFDMEITLTKRVITTRGPTDGLYLNEFFLKDEAFVPKRYSVQLEKGSFLTTMEAKTGGGPSWAPRYAYRLVFDHSPYPHAKEWKEFTEDEQYMLPFPPIPYHEWKEFCSGQLEKDDGENRETGS